MDVKDIINSVNKSLEERLSYIPDTLYGDEPVVTTGSRLMAKKEPVKQKPELSGISGGSDTGSKAMHTNSGKDRIKTMIAFAHTQEAYLRSKDWLFYNQAKMMEDYEQDYEYEPQPDRTIYTPVYSDLDENELRGYFSWRKDIRHGVFGRTELRFAYIYMYELLNGIGASSAEDAFCRLESFVESYSPLDRRIVRNASVWLVEYAAFHNIDPILLDNCKEIVFDRHILTLLDPESSDEILYEAICALSSYSASASAFAKKHSEDFRTVTCRVFRALVSYYEKNRKNGYIDRVFGKPVPMQIQLFKNAVVYKSYRSHSYTYEINPIHHYTFSHGLCYCYAYYGNRGKNKTLGETIRTIDGVMREAYGFSTPVYCGDVTAASMDIIRHTVKEFLEERRKMQRPVVEIDLSKLSGIRLAAEKTCEKLLVDDELPAPPLTIPSEELEEQPEHTRAPDCVPSPLPGQTSDAAEKTDTGELSSCGLDEDERLFLRSLLSDGNAAEIARSAGKMPSLLADSINEKLFDMFGDTVIEFDGDTPAVIEDYSRELSELLAKKGG